MAALLGGKLLGSVKKANENTQNFMKSDLALKMLKVSIISNHRVFIRIKCANELPRCNRHIRDQ